MQKITTALLLLLTAIGFSQKFELGNVTVEELSQKSHPQDTAAVAAILFNKRETRFEYTENGFEMLTKVACKIKIYKKEGYEFATYSRPYYIGGNVKENLNFSKAYTYNLVNGKVEKTKLRSEGEFDEKVNKFWNRKKITMPNVKEGAIIEFEYLLKSPGIGIIDKWDFQHIIPVNYSEFITVIPEYLVYNTDVKGGVAPRTSTEKRNKSYTFTTKERGESIQYKTQTTFTDQKLEYTETKTTYIMDNLPSIKDEAYVNNIKNYTSSIAHELSATQFPNRPYENLSTDWETVTKKIYEMESFGGELNRTGYFEYDLKTLLAGVDKPEERILTVFNFVKSKVKWNDFYGYQCDGGVKKAYKEMSGNVAEINLMLTAMLRHAGLNANPVLLSTRSNGIPVFPNRTAYNYVICAVEADGGQVLLDATNKNAFPNILPIRDLNWTGRMIRKNGSSSDVDLMPKMVSKEALSLMATINKDGSVEGKLKQQYSDYNAYLFRAQHGELSNHLERLEKKYKGLEVDGYEMANKTDLNNPVVETYNFKYNNSVEVIGDKMYFSPLMFFALSENPFKQEVREYPIDFSYPNQDRYIVNITIPDGYQVESLPQSVTIPMSDNAAALKYMIAKTDNKIQLSMTFDINTPILSADYYTEIKSFFAEMVKKQTEKIVIRKI